MENTRTVVSIQRFINGDVHVKINCVDNVIFSRLKFISTKYLYSLLTSLVSQKEHNNRMGKKSIIKALGFQRYVLKLTTTVMNTIM